VGRCDIEIETCSTRRARSGSRTTWNLKQGVGWSMDVDPEGGSRGHWRWRERTKNEAKEQGIRHSTAITVDPISLTSTNSGIARTRTTSSRT
jgi:hypothetical protein